MPPAVPSLKVTTTPCTALLNASLTPAEICAGSGVLMARRAVAAAVERAVSEGVDYQVAHITTPAASQSGRREVDSVTTNSGARIAAGQFIFACGAWLWKIFPDLLGPRIFPSRQEVFFFGVPPGDSRFAPPLMPTWLNMTAVHVIVPWQAPQS